MQLTLTLFMLSAGIMQLIIGPISDQWGRKKTMYLCFAGFALGSALCAAADSLAGLVGYRIIQAIGSCGMMALAFAVVRDVQHGNESAKTYSYLSGIIAFSPMFAPFIGSFLDLSFGWRSTFIILLLVAIWSAVSVMSLLPETLPPEKRQRFHWQIFRDYQQVLSHPRFFWYTLISAMGMSYFYLFCAMSPYILITLLHIPEAHYGYYFCFMGVSLFFGSFIAGKVVGKIGVYQTTVIGMLMALLGALIMVIWYLIAGLSVDNFIWPMLLLGIGGSFQFGAGAGGSMEPFGETAGAASGVGGAFRFLFASGIGSLVITKHISSTLPLCGTAVIFSLLGLCIIFRYRSALR
jgi:DHA1 family bicyclomycin/chloramphenicol resistance-like MFS transporter